MEFSRRKSLDRSGCRLAVVTLLFPYRRGEFHSRFLDIKNLGMRVGFHHHGAAMPSVALHKEIGNPGDF